MPVLRHIPVFLIGAMVYQPALADLPLTVD